MLQKELIKRLKGRYETKMDDNPNSRRNYPIRDKKRLKQAIFSKKT